MRKRIIIAGVLFFVSVVLSIVSYNSTTAICEEVLNSTQRIKEYIESENLLALSEAEKMKESWENQYKILSSYIPHEQLEKSNVSLNSLLNYLKEGQNEIALLICEEIKIDIDHVMKYEKLIFSNIF